MMKFTLALAATALGVTAMAEPALAQANEQFLPSLVPGRMANSFLNWRGVKRAVPPPDWIHNREVTTIPRPDLLTPARQRWVSQQIGSFGRIDCGIHPGSYRARWCLLSWQRGRGDDQPGDYKYLSSADHYPPLFQSWLPVTPTPLGIRRVGRRGLASQTRQSN